MNARDYIISERFIHDVLLARALGAVKKLPELWRKDKRIEPSLFLWPESAVATDDGGSVKGLVIFPLPPDRAEHDALIKGALKKTGAYALLLVHNEGQRIRALFESPHGTRAWVYPLKRSADTWVLGKIEVSDDKETLGLLWSPKQGHS